jgi:tRNA(Ile)-lysidine synthase
MIQERFNNDFNHLLGERPKSIALAVSGGVDSVAMLYLASSWAQDFGVELTVFSVNHNLRALAVDDVRYVENLAKKLGAKFFALSWNSGEDKSALQERARQGRYDLMTEKCLELGINLLLTAHHFDDVLETYLMRKAKKSGIFGLSSSASYFHNNIRVLRPLFNFFKTELVEFLQSQNIAWREDDSNQSDLYERNRARKKIAALSNIDKDQLVAEVKAINEKVLLLNEQLILAMAESLQVNNYGFAKIDLHKIKNFCQDIKIQIFNYVLTVISGKVATPRFRNIEKILARIVDFENMKCSLHGCVIKKKGPDIWIFREQSVIEDDVQLLHGQLYWDNRFMVSGERAYCHPSEGRGIAKNLTISRLSLEEYVQIKDKINLRELAKISDNNHKLILFTLPVIKNLEKIVAIPHISYYDEFGFEKDLELVFRPKFISRFTHFL